MSEVYDFTDLTRDFKSQGIDVYDVFGRSGAFDKWCDSKGYGQTDPDGKHRGSSQIWFGEYQRCPQGAAKEPPHANLWHWFLNTFDGCWKERHQGGRYKDVIVTQKIVDTTPWVSALLSPMLALNGGKIKLRMIVS